MKPLLWAGLVLLAALPYAPALHAPLLYDDRTLLDNRWLVKEAGPASVFAQDYWSGTKHERSDLYRPLTILSLAWNMRLAPSREGIRAVNVAAHAVAALALFWLLLAIVPTEAAWTGAALFSVHPLASEAVLWAVGRAEIFSAILGLAAFVLFLKLDRRRGFGGYPLAISAASWFAALCFKESAAAWILVGAVWVLLRPRSAGQPASVLWGRAGVYLAAFAAFYALRVSVVGWGHTPPPFVDNPLVAVDGAVRAANAVLLFARYLAKMAWPGTLSVDYGFDQIPVVPLLPWAAAAAAAIASSLVAAVIALRRKGHVAAAFLTAFVPCAFAVTGNLALPIGTMFAERLAYTPLMGFCGLAALAVARIESATWRRVAVAAAIVACGTRTMARGGDYRDLRTLNAATAAASPRAVKALANEGRTRLRLGDPAGARPLLERAVAIWPDYARAWQLLAEACDVLGDATRADDARRQAAAAASRAGVVDEPL